MTGLSGVVELVSGGNRNCVRTGDGAVRCWGENYYGVLGDGTTMTRLSPTLVPNL